MKKIMFSLIIKDIDLNYIKGNISVTNGTITNITTTSGWMNKTGINNSFYFYHDGIKVGDYLVATFEVTMSMAGNSQYSIENINYGTYNCQKDMYGNYFGENGDIVSESVFNNTCGKSKDATLKSLSPSVGILSPSFSSEHYYYALNVPNTVSSVVFDTITTNKYASVSGKKCILTSNVTDCNIKVTSEAGSIQNYYVTVFKENSVSSDSFITNFKVHNR